MPALTLEFVSKGPGSAVEGYRLRLNFVSGFSGFSND
jgi:hypothetical protein